jgi:hypothetical protein
MDFREETKMKRLIARSLILVLCAGAGYPAAAQEGTKEEAKKAGEQAKEAGKDAGSAAKHAGKATAKATKKTGRSVKNAVTGDIVAVCGDGKEHSGNDPADACKDHGGVQKK